MASLSTKPQEVTSTRSVNDEFDNYLKRQRVKTTFNGLEIETFSWYKKVLGLLQKNCCQKKIEGKKK